MKTKHKLDAGREQETMFKAAILQHLDLVITKIAVSVGAGEPPKAISRAMYRADAIVNEPNVTALEHRNVSCVKRQDCLTPREISLDTTKRPIVDANLCLKTMK